MKFIKNFLLVLGIAVLHYLLQIASVLLSFSTKLVYHNDPFWTLGGVAIFVSKVCAKILVFPFEWVFQKLPTQWTGSEDLPYLLNSLLWASIIGFIIVRARKNRKPRYLFVRGASR